MSVERMRVVFNLLVSSGIGFSGFSDANINALCLLSTPPLMFLVDVLNVHVYKRFDLIVCETLTSNWGQPICQGQ